MAIQTPTNPGSSGGRFEVLRVAREQGLIDDETLLRADVELRVADRRNTNTVVVIDGVPRWFAKQARSGSPAHLVEHEAGLLSRWLDDRRLATPRLVAYDAPRCVAITAFVDDAETLAARLERLGRLNLAIARQLGRQLARLHARLRWSAARPASFELRPTPPWCYSLAAPLAETLADASAGSLRLLARVQSTALAEALDRLTAAWQPTTLVHNDLKFDNVLVGRSRPFEITIADWETGASGDPAWDVGSLVGEFLTAWLASMSPDRDASIDEIRASATRPLAAMLPVIRAYLDAYRAGADASPEFLYRTVANAGARVLQSAYESLQDHRSLTPLSALQMQLAVNIISRPEQAAVRLLELGAA